MGNIKDMRWGRVLIGTLAAFVLGFLTVLIFVAGFVALRSANEGELRDFTQSLLPSLVALIVPLFFTFVLSRWAAKGVTKGQQINGLFVGFFVVLISFIYRGFRPTVTEFLILFSTILLGWLGGLQAQRAANRL